MAITMSEKGGDSRWLRDYNNVGGFIHNGPTNLNMNWVNNVYKFLSKAGVSVL